MKTTTRAAVAFTAVALVGSMAGMPAQAGPEGHIEASALVWCNAILPEFPHKNKEDTNIECQGGADVKGYYIGGENPDQVGAFAAAEFATSKADKIKTNFNCYNIQYLEDVGVSIGLANGHCILSADRLVDSKGKPPGRVTLHFTFEWQRVGALALITIPAKKVPKGGWVETHLHEGGKPKIDKGHKGKTTNRKVNCPVGSPQSVAVGLLEPKTAPATEKPGSELEVQVIAALPLGLC